MSAPERDKEPNRKHGLRRRRSAEAETLALITVFAVLIAVAGMAARRAHDDAAAGQSAAGEAAGETTGQAGVSWLHFVTRQVDSGDGPIRLDFEAPTGGRAQLEVRDPSDRRVALVFDEEVAGGYHRRSWDGLDPRGARVPAGVYSARLQLGGESVVTELIVL